MEFEKNEEGRIRFTSTDGIDYATWNKLLLRINHLGYAISDVDFLKSYFDRKCYLNEDQSIEVLAVFGEEHNVELYSPEIIKRDNQRAKKLFGVTNDYELAGYLLLDGEMLNFSYDNYMRDMDHRDIKEALTEYGDGYSDALIQFVNYGNIRLMQTGFELSKRPTQKQRRMLAGFIRKSPELYVDISNTRGQVVKEFGYQVASPNDVLNDIDSYFDSVSV